MREQGVELNWVIVACDECGLRGGFGEGEEGGGCEGADGGVKANCPLGGQVKGGRVWRQEILGQDVGGEGMVPCRGYKCCAVGRELYRSE